MGVATHEKPQRSLGMILASLRQSGSNLEPTGKIGQSPRTMRPASMTRNKTSSTNKNNNPKMKLQNTKKRNLILKFATPDRPPRRLLCYQ